MKQNNQPESSGIVKIPEADMRGVFDHRCDQLNCPICSRKEKDVPHGESEPRPCAGCGKHHDPPECPAASEGGTGTSVFEPFKHPFQPNGEPWPSIYPADAPYCPDIRPDKPVASVEGQRTGEGACDKCGKPVFWHGDSWYHVNGSDVMKCGAASVPGVEGMGAREWREEFPCTVTHQSYPEGTTCLDCRDYALANNPPHRFTPDFRQRYIDYDRELFCYNCWSCIKSRSLRGAGGPDYPADEFCQVAIENPDMQVIVKELTAELKEDFAIAYSLSNGEFDGLEAHLWMLVHLARKRGAGGEREPDWKKLYEEMRDFSKTWQAASESREQALAEELQSMTELTQSWFKKNRALEAELKAQTEWRKVSEAAESREQAMRENLKVSHNVLRTELGRKCDIQREDGLCEICRQN